jgi:hypothetical protein
MASVTQLLAVYGATLSSLVFGWSLFRDLTERGKLKVIASVVTIHPPTPGFEGDQLALRITNVGRQNVWITNIGGRFPGQSVVIVPRSRFPTKLEPGELLDEVFPLSTVQRPETLLHYWVTDSTGRVYRTSAANSKEVRNNVLTARGQPAVQKQTEILRAFQRKIAVLRRR